MNRMNRALKKIGALVGVLSLPLLLNGCTSIFSLLLCLLTAAKSADDSLAVLSECLFLSESSSPGLGEETPLVGDVLAIRAKEYSSRYENGPTTWQSGPFEVTIDLQVDRSSPLLAGFNRMYLRVEDDVVPAHFIQLFATPGLTDGYSLSAVSDAMTLGTMDFPTADAMQLRIVRDGDGYHALATQNGGSFVLRGVLAAPAAGARPRVRFGTDQMNPDLRVYFHEVRITADAFGDEHTAPIFSELASALDALDGAMTESEREVPDFGAIESALGDAEDRFAEAKDLLSDAKKTGGVEKQNQPKLALKALKAGMRKAKQGGSIAGRLDDDGTGNENKMAKRILDAHGKAHLAIANLMGVKTKNANKILDHVIVEI